jgi:hypothetical protein
MLYKKNTQQKFFGSGGSVLLVVDSDAMLRTQELAAGCWCYY